MRRIELLAPARDLKAGIAAVDCGADAIYIGGPAFGARNAAGNTPEDIAGLVDYARLFGVRVYAALNTVVFENELAAAERTARAVIDAGVDALIIQDMAYLRMGLDGVEFHASTQTCNNTPEKVRFLQECGFARVILERGLTLDRIVTIRIDSNVELECFVHGAVCVGYSGQCYLSRSMGPRSGNRGDCMQACRLSYDLINGDGEALIRNKYLLSVMDMDMTDRLPRLIDAGVNSFKIEGRLKDETYVRNTVLHYRRRLDGIIDRREDLCRASRGRIVTDMVADPSKTFTRDGSVWMIDGKRPGMASFDTPKAKGEFVGKATGVRGNSFELKGDTRLSAGDGITFFTDGRLTGTNINGVEGERIFPNRMDGIAEGRDIFRNYDHSYITRLNKTPVRRILDAAARIKITGKDISLVLTCDDGTSAWASIENRFSPARNDGEAQATIKKHIEKTGGTAFAITAAQIDIDAGSAMPFIPVSVLNGLRREALDGLAAKLKNIGIDRCLSSENLDYPYPEKVLVAEANVTNSLSERFYCEHGVETIAKGLDLAESFDEERVMTTPYCILRETGRCLKEKGGEDPRWNGELYISRGKLRYRLVFDCRKCEMSLVKT